MENGSVCVTGAGRGLGYALVEAFLNDTDKTVLAVSRNTAQLDMLQEQFRNRLHVLHADVCTPHGREQVLEAVLPMPDLEVLVHNAGTLVYKPFIEISEDELKRLYEVNVFAPFLLTQKLLSQMERTHVISISSIGGVQGSLKFPGLSAYSSSKAALNALTEMWAEEFKDTNLCFNCLALGSVETQMFQEAFPGFAAASTPETMANYIVKFAYDAPKVVRGKIFSISLGNP